MLSEKQTMLHYFEEIVATIVYCHLFSLLIELAPSTTVKSQLKPAIFSLPGNNLEPLPSQGIATSLSQLKEQHPGKTGAPQRTMF